MCVHHCLLVTSPAGHWNDELTARTACAQAYLEYYNDIMEEVDKNSPLTAQLEAARKHYMVHGHSENRVYKRIRVLLRYTACGALMNQHYAHISGLTLAAALGADVVMGPAVSRETHANYVDSAPVQNKLQWRAVPFESIWDPYLIKR